MCNKLLLAFLFIAPFILFAQQKTTERQNVSLTIYNQNMALIRELRMVELKKGINSIIVPDVPETIDGTSMYCESITAPSDFKILEQNYQYDLVHHAKLLEKYVGKEIEFIRYDPSTQKEFVVKGNLLASGWQPQSFENNQRYYSGGSMIAEIDGKIEIAPSGRIVLPSLPEGLILKPQLNWKVHAKKDGKHTIEFRYLASQLNWNCTYIALLNDSDTKVDLTGWVTITNNSGSNYINAELKLVAGDLNIIQPKNQRMDMLMKYSVTAEEAEGFQQKDFFEYKLYSLQRTTDIRNQETKQIELISAQNVTVNKEFVYDGLSDEWRIWQRNYSYRDQSSFGQKSNTKVGVYISLKNSIADGLGIALPKGNVRLYKKDTDGKEHFIGEDEIDHTPKDETVRLYLGNAFDLTGKRVQKDFRVVVADHVYEETIEVTVKNHKEQPVTIMVYDHPWRWRDWVISKSSHEWDKIDHSTLRFKIQLAKDEQKTITYTVRYTW